MFHLKSVTRNVREIKGPMRLESVNRDWRPFGLLLVFVGSILFVVPFLKSESNKN